jgi:putative membrane-bound dehydrogenase-like protein
MRNSFAVLSLLLVPALAQAQPGQGNRLAYLDEVDPYYPHKSFPKLITPQWVGEEGVDAVVILAIDDMRGPKKYEAFLRPILRRLKEIDGRAPVSIMTNQVDPKDPQLQAWLKEGLSLECHTLDHPCPFFKNGFAKAKETYDKCVDLMSEIPNNKPVAFRMPCCDSLNTPSPRFFAEIFNKTTEKGKYLSIDSSVFNVFTANDAELPRELVQMPDGSERFKKYLPADGSFVNTIEDYPYPYVIGRLCWQFPCVTPSDWQAQNLHKPYNPQTVKDWKAALDCTVIKKGVMTMVFHPHGWIKNDQLVELVDYADKKYGKKVKFLNFREALERLEKNLLDTGSLREFLKPQGTQHILKDRFGTGYQAVLSWTPKDKGSYEFHQRTWHGKWLVTNSLLDGELPLLNVFTWTQRVINLGANRPSHWVYNGENPGEICIMPLSSDGLGLPIARLFKLPVAASVNDGQGDYGLRFIDLDGDGYDDIVFSNEKEYGVYLFRDMKEGWSRKVIAGKAGGPGSIPMIVNKRENMGFFVHSNSLCWANEGTTLMKGLIVRVPFQELLKGMDPPAMKPEASLKAIKPRPGFQVELMAAEPLVNSPIAFNFGPDGRLWVVEMGDYPKGVDGKGKAGGRVKILEDTKGIGKFDKATLFLDGLHYPTAVLPWKKGALVIAAPEIFYAEDTTGTGNADMKQVLFTGLKQGNPQHLANSLVWGLDNWIYCANGDSDGEVTSLKTGKKVNIKGRDFRIRPDTGEIELQSGRTQFGRARDDWGNWFGNNNSQPMWHFVLDDAYLSRNPFIPSPDPRVMVPVVSGNAPVFPIARILPRFNDPHTAGRFTSACSAIIYRDHLFGPAFAGNMFVSEPVHNLVHREIVKPKGLTFTSYRAADEQQSEFLASADNWFRPTTIQTGPDGALWIADMYRYVIEHPQWIPKDWQAKLDLRAGEDKGRMYRVFPIDAKPRALPRLDKMTTAELVECLDSPSGWQRDMAQMLLVQRQDPAATDKLLTMLERRNPLARLHALWTLAGMGKLTNKDLIRLLEDGHPALRKSALRLLEPYLAGDIKLPLARVKLDEDPDPQVRQQLAYTLGAWSQHKEAARRLAKIALTDNSDPYMLAAVFSSIHKDNFPYFVNEVVAAADQSAGSALLPKLVKMATAFSNKDGLAVLLGTISSPNDNFTPAQFATLGSILDGLDDSQSSLKQWNDKAPADVKKHIEAARRMIKVARSMVADAKLPLEDRARALRLLGRDFDRQAEDKKTIAGLLTPQTPSELQTAAVATLARLRGIDVPALLIAGWKGHGPAVRNQTLDTLLSRFEWLNPTLDALEKKTILPSEVDAIRRQRLLDSKIDAVRARAAQLFAAASNVDRQKLIASYRPALALKGDSMKGAEIFKKNCSACHQLGGIGNNVGPDLVPEVNRPGEVLLIAILDPNQAVEARYISYTATMKNGKTVNGLIASETGSGITLIAADGQKHVIARSDLDELTSTGKSLMPEGLEKDISVPDMADLIAYLRKHVPSAKRKTFEGNSPAVVTANADGALTLLASNCEIFGRTLVLEPKHGNLGFWHSDDDKAVWTVELPKAGKYILWLDWACAPGSAGNTLALDVGDTRAFTVKVAATADWDTYNYARVGEVTLEAGRQTMMIRAQGPLQNALIALKGLKLVPK